MPAPTYRAADYAAAIQALLPRGRAWPRDADAVLTKTIDGLAKAYEASNARANQLLVDAFPDTSYELLGEWENTLGLPTIYEADPTTLRDRQETVVAALTDTGGQSIAYFTALAARLGYAVAITQYRPFTVCDPVNRPIWGLIWAFTWHVDATSTAGSSFDVDSDVDEPITSVNAVALPKVFDRYRPAHTIVTYTFL